MTFDLMTIYNGKGVRLKATVSEFGPVLMSKILDLNSTQSGILSIMFKYCDDNDLPLLNLEDLKKLLKYSKEEGKEKFKEEYGSMSSMSIGTILRKVIELESQGADNFFGELSFEIDDLLQTDRNGNGIINIIRLTDIQDRPKLFSTFMLSLLAEVYHELPEQGDTDKPKLCIFIDEAHLVFDNASKALLEQIEAIVKLIRSKGVGIYFITQNPTDVPDAVLSQLGLKVQHALRAFTAKDRKAIKKTAENYPDTDYYETDKVLTSLGIGEALVTCLNEKGIPTPLAATLLRAPKTRMDILTPKEIKEVVSYSRLVDKYNKEIDSESAYELLNKRIAKARSVQEKQDKKESKAPIKKRGRAKKEVSFIEKASKNTMVRQLGRTVLRELTRSLFGKWGR
jgi:DNA helicase HerA-like ATPase